MAALTQLLGAETVSTLDEKTIQILRASIEAEISTSPAIAKLLKKRVQDDLAKLRKKVVG